MPRKKVSAKKRKFNKAVSEKIKKIKKEGIRRNTRKPVSKSNPRRPVSQRQAEAVAMSIERKRMGMKKSGHMMA